MRKLQGFWRTGLHHGTAVTVTAVFLLPLFWMLVTSVRQPGLPPQRTVEWLPESIRWQNYADLFVMMPTARYIVNSLKVIAVAVPVTLFIASTAGFGMSQLASAWRRRLFLGSAVLLMIPGTAVWMFRFQILQWLGLIDSLWALIIPAFAASNPLFVLLFYWTYRQVPASIFESARLDGADALTVWWQMARPLARPTAVGVIILTFVMYWNDFIAPVLYIYDAQLYTLPLGIQILKQLEYGNWPYLMAGSVVMMLPIIFLFILLQRAFLHNISLANLFERN